jgi:hypothetical protein
MTTIAPICTFAFCIRSGTEVITCCISHRGSLKYAAEFTALSEERRQHMSHTLAYRWPHKKKIPLPKHRVSEETRELDSSFGSEILSVGLREGHNV